MGENKRALTRDEYKAKAMLLGMGYSQTAHCFYPLGPTTRHPPKATFGHHAEWIDADTLEPVPHEERMRRRSKYRTNPTQWPVTTGSNDAPQQADEDS